MKYNKRIYDKRTIDILIAEITSRESTLLGLVENLGPQLTSTTVLDRVKAVDILARVFSTLPKDFLTEKELEFIVEFLCNRLKDQHLVIPKAILCCYPIVSDKLNIKLHLLVRTVYVRSRCEI